MWKGTANTNNATLKAAIAKREKITVTSLDIFLAYAEDAPNWTGHPPIGVNVGSTKEDRGNITQLKRRGLITTEGTRDHINGAIVRDTWITFTLRGKMLAEFFGLELGDEW